MTELSYILAKMCRFNEVLDKIRKSSKCFENFTDDEKDIIDVFTI